MTNEQKLWVAIVDKAIADLSLRDSCRDGYCNENRIHRESAYDFLFSNLPAYREWRMQVFQMAGLDPQIDLSNIKPRIRGVRDD